MDTPNSYSKVSNSSVKEESKSEMNEDQQSPVCLSSDESRSKDKELQPVEKVPSPKAKSKPIIRKSVSGEKGP